MYRGTGDFSALCSYYMVWEGGHRGVYNVSVMLKLNIHESSFCVEAKALAVYQDTTECYIVRVLSLLGNCSAVFGLPLSTQTLGLHLFTANIL